MSGPIIFTYQTGSEQLGNTLLRAHQVSDLIAQHAPPFEVYSQSIENLYLSRPRNATIVVCKTGVKVRHLGLLRQFLKDGNRIVFDVVDGIVPRALLNLPHAYVCSSVTESIARQADGWQTISSLHSPDHRMPLHDFDSKHFGVVYFGLPENALHIDVLDDVVVLPYQDMPAHRADSPMPGGFPPMAQASHHFSVRRWNERDGFKPLTKAAVAARFGACLIASAEESEAVTLLGEDYPYLAASSALEDVRQVIDFARESFNGEPWRLAVERMKDLLTVTCPVATAHALVEGISRLGD